MAKFRFEICLGSILVLLFLAFCMWEQPALMQGALTKPEIDGYITAMDRQLVIEGKGKLLARLRAWAEADDGKPVYMLNLMSLYPQLHRFPGAPDFKGTPRESNSYYEGNVAPILLKTGSYPLIGATPQGASLLGSDAKLDETSRVLLVRYTGRRAFLQLLADPAYAPIMPYKLMALDVALLPLSMDTMLPDARLALAIVLLVMFLGIGWYRAVRRG